MDTTKRLILYWLCSFGFLVVLSYILRFMGYCITTRGGSCDSVGGPFQNAFLVSIALVILWLFKAALRRIGAYIDEKHLLGIKTGLNYAEENALSGKAKALDGLKLWGVGCGIFVLLILGFTLWFFITNPQS